jgi:TonB family protein
MSGNGKASRVRVRCVVSASLMTVMCVAAAPRSSAAQATISGSVSDTMGVPIFGARVTVAGSTAETQTDPSGKFRLANIPMGPTTVKVRRLGFLPYEVALELAQKTGAEVKVRMTPVAAALPPVVVRPGHMTYTGRLAGYYTRLESKSSGYFISREDIDRDHPSTTGQLLQRIPGVRAMRGRGGITGIRLRGRMCWPLIWLDGTPMPAGEVDLDAFVPSSIQGIEIYLGSTTAPMAYTYSRGLSSCGTILIWSRGPDTDPVHRSLSAMANLDDLVSRLAVYTPEKVDRRAHLDSTQTLDLKFPPSLFASRTRGLVIAEFVVDTLGRVEDTTIGIVSSTGPLFTDAVRAALVTAAFVPALKDGHPVRQLVHQPFEFDVGSPVAQRQ